MADAELDDVLRRLEESPTNVPLLDVLIELTSKGGRPEDATRHLWVAAHLFEKAGDGKGALQMLERLARLDPEATRNLASLAAVCVRLTFPAESQPLLGMGVAHFTRRNDAAGLVEWVVHLGRLRHTPAAFADALAEPVIKARAAGDLSSLQKLGELFQKAGDPKRAATWFASVAESYASDGFFLKAVALFKQVVKLDPSLNHVNFRLGELHAALQLTSEAETYYRVAVRGYTQAGDAQGAERAREKLVALQRPPPAA